AFRRKRASKGNETREHQREPQHSWRDRRRAARVDLKPEVRDDQRKHDELRQGRYELARPPLRDQVLPRDRQRDRDRAHYWTIRSREPGPRTRPFRNINVRWQSLVASAWSCVASTAVLPRMTAASRSAPAAS